MRQDSSYKVFFLFLAGYFLLRASATKGMPGYDPLQETITTHLVIHTRMGWFGFEKLNEVDSLIIPLKRAGRLFLIDAIIDGEEGNLIFDTGSMEMVLNKTYFRNYVKTSNQTTSGINGVVDDVSIVALDELIMRELSFHSLSANLVDLSHIENKRNIKVLGLFGFGLIRNFEITLDLKNDLLKLHRLNKSGELVSKNANDFKADFTDEIEISSGIVFVKVTIGGKILRFCLDTAAETNALSSIAPKSVIDRFMITRSAILKGAGSQSREVFYGNVVDFSLGSKDLSPMPAILSNIENLCNAYNFRFDGILGYDFMVKGVIRINLIKKELKIQFTEDE